MLRFLAASLLALGCLAQGPETAVIRPGVPWYDTSGNRIYAGGANMYLEDGVYYLVGEGKKVLSGDCSDCFNMYKSTDLQTWDFVGCVLKNENIVGPAGTAFPFRMERPKVFKCPATQKYMMWFHCDTPGFGIQSVGVLQADAVAGPYSFVAPCFKPDGQKSYDMGTFVDDASRGGDGHAYLIRSVNNQFAGISQMTADCTNVTGIVSSGPDMEGQALMRDAAGVLHAAGSHLTGWAPNAAQFVTSPNATLVGAQWVDNINPSGDATTYETQSTFIFPYKHADGHTTFIWMAGAFLVWRRRMRARRAPSLTQRILTAPIPPLARPLEHGASARTRRAGQHDQCLPAAHPAHQLPAAAQLCGRCACRGHLRRRRARAALYNARSRRRPHCARGLGAVRAQRRWRALAGRLRRRNGVARGRRGLHLGRR